jgi:hypothetical protein
MRNRTTPTTPTLAPLRVVSEALEEVEVDLETFRRDLVLAERAGLVVLAAGSLVVGGLVVLAVVRWLRRRDAGPATVVPAARWPEVPVAPGRTNGSRPTGRHGPGGPTDGSPSTDPAGPDEPIQAADTDGPPTP